MIEDRTELRFSVTDGAAREDDISDDQLLEIVYDTYGRPLYRYAFAILGSPDDAEDALGELLARLAKDVCGMKRAANPQAYLFRAVRNAAYDLLRAKRRRARLDQPLVDSLGYSAAEDAESATLRAALLSLPLEQREVVVLKSFEQMTFQEISTVVGAPVNTVASRYRYAIDKLRCALSEGQSDG